MYLVIRHIIPFAPPPLQLLDVNVRHVILCHSQHMLWIWCLKVVGTWEGGGGSKGKVRNVWIFLRPWMKNGAISS